MSIYKSKINPVSSLMFLEEVVNGVTATWTAGERLGLLFASPFKRRKIRDF